MDVERNVAEDVHPLNWAYGESRFMAKVAASRNHRISISALLH